MVQKRKALPPQAPPAPRRRGRPRSYDPDVAVRRAREVFWKKGYAATSLDDLSAAMHMNRPSMYAAFGDKRALYLATLERYWDEVRSAWGRVFDEPIPLAEALRRIYGLALSTYTTGDDGQRGCYAIGTAVTGAFSDPELRRMLHAGMRKMDASFTRVIERAKERGELPPGADPIALGRIASATIHTLSLRARAGATHDELDAVVDAAVRTICGA